MSDYEDYSASSPANNDPTKGGWPEQMDRDQVNDTARENLGATRRFWDNPNWKNVVKDFAVTQSPSAPTTQVRIAGTDATALFPPRTKVRVRSSDPDEYAFVQSVSFVSPDTLVDLGFFDDGASGEVPASTNGIDAHFLTGGDNGIGRAAFNEEPEGFVIPDGTTRNALQAAITAAEADGRIVLLSEGGTEFQIGELPLQITGPVRIWGRGPRATTLVAANSRDDALVEILDGAAGIEIVGLTLNGNSSNQTSTDAEIRIGNDVRRLTMRDVEVRNAYGRAIHFNAASVVPTSQRYEDIHLENVKIDGTGNHGLEITDPNNLNRAFRVIGLHAERIGGIGAATAGSAAIRTQSPLHISAPDIDMDGAGADAQGIWLDNIASTDGASYSQITNFRITGTGNAQVGIHIQANRNVEISNGFVGMTGANALPIQIDGIGGAPDDASQHKISNVDFEGGIRNAVANDANDNAFDGCTFRDQLQQAMQVDGPGTLFLACVFDGAGAAGVNFRSGADNSVLAGCVVSNTVGAGVQIGANTDDIEILGNRFLTIGGDGVSIATGCNRAIITGNRFQSVSGSQVSDAGARTVTQWNVPEFVKQSFTRTASSTAYGALSTEITGLTNITPPGLGADGVRQYRVTTFIEGTASGSAGSGGQSADIQLRVGPLGTVIVGVGDPIVATQGAHLDNDRAVVIPMVAIITPAAGDKVTISGTADSGTFTTTANRCYVQIEQLPE